MRKDTLLPPFLALMTGGKLGRTAIKRFIIFALGVGALACGAILLIVSTSPSGRPPGSKPFAHKLAYEKAIAQRPKPVASRKGKPKEPVLPPFETTTTPEPQAASANDPAVNATGATGADQANDVAAAPGEDAGAPGQARPLPEESGGPYADMPPMPGDSTDGPAAWGGNGEAQGTDALDQQEADDYPAFGEEWVEVVVSGAAMRASASEDAPMLFAFPYGRNLRVVSRYEGWVEVTDPQSAATGWMEMAYLAPAGTARPGYAQDETAYDEPRGRRHPGLFQEGGLADIIERAFGGGF
jgi:hypothetical protein